MNESARTIQVKFRLVLFKDHIKVHLKKYISIWKCGRVRFIAPVLKTDEQKCSVSSNLTASAKLETWMSGLNQRFAKPSLFERSAAGSNPAVSARLFDI